MSNQYPMLEAALEVALMYPVFPTIDKKPCWSNKDLRVPKGEGGYKIATRDPERVRKLFSHRRAMEIAVPMGEMSGLMCIDADIYKSEEAAEWVMANWHYLKDTLVHGTRSGGLHFIFEHPGNHIKFRATLAPGIDVKASGRGYVCWPGTEGYRAMENEEVRSALID